MTWRHTLRPSSGPNPKGTYKFWRAAKDFYFFKEKRHFLSDIFLSPSRVFWGGQKRIQCLPSKCPWRKVEAANELANPAFLKSKVQESSSLKRQTGEIQRQLATVYLNAFLPCFMMSSDTVTSLEFYAWGRILLSAVSLGNSPAKGHLLENISVLNVSSEKNRDTVKATHVRHY